MIVKKIVLKKDRKGQENLYSSRFGERMEDVLTGIVGDGTIEGGLNALAARSDATGVERTARGAQRSARHPADKEELASRSTDTALVEPTAKAHCGQAANHISQRLAQEGCRS